MIKVILHSIASLFIFSFLFYHPNFREFKAIDYNHHSVHSPASTSSYANAKVRVIQSVKAAIVQEEIKLTRKVSGKNTLEIPINIEDQKIRPTMVFYSNAKKNVSYEDKKRGEMNFFSFDKIKNFLIKSEVNNQELKEIDSGERELKINVIY